MLTFPFPAGPGGTAPAEFAELRAGDPVAKVRLADETEIHVVTRYADVVTVLTDDRFSRACAAELPGSGFGRNQRTGLLDLDPPEHGVLRAPLDRALSEERIRSWRPALERAVRDLLDDFLSSARPADFVAGFAAPLAARTICELVGLGARDSARVARWVDQVLPTGNSPEQMAAAKAGLDGALSELIAKRHVTAEDDIASMLLGEDGSGPGLTDADAQTVLFGLLISGYVGNRNALARHLFALLATPDSFATLRATPATAVQELLRFYPSGNDGLLRVVTAPVELSGVRLDSGDVVMPLIAAASHDPEVFDPPDHLDLRRRPNPHVSLGRGTHACPGHHLVGTLFELALVRLATAVPGLRLAVPAAEVEHTSDLLPLGVRSLPVRW